MSKIMWFSEAQFENYYSRLFGATEDSSAKCGMKILEF